MAVFYPSTAVARGLHTEVGSNVVEAARDAPFAPGRFPLIVVSHGHGGSMMGHHDLCKQLAERGFVVGVVEHVGDSYRDQSAFRTDRMLLGRPYQLSALVDAILGDATLSPHVDGSRIGAAGFSAGGYTSLVVAGAKPDFSRLAVYCARHPHDDDFCGHGSVRITIANPAPTSDARIKAVFAMAPLGVFFGPGAFDAVTAPVFLAWATQDEVLVPPDNAAVVRTGLRTLQGERQVDAGHYVFLAPCSAALDRAAPEICRDAPGVDRVAVHAAVNQDAVAFFRKALGEQ
jgi:predicted dienelactone hydrolase